MELHAALILVHVPVIRMEWGAENGAHVLIHGLLCVHLALQVETVSSVVLITQTKVW